MNRIILSGIAAFFLAACSVNNYELKTPNNISNEQFEIKHIESLSKDANLNKLIKLALLNNEDIKMAANNLLIAESYLSTAKIDRQPKVTANAGVNLVKPKNTDLSKNYSLGLNLSYELDLFNRLGKEQENKLFLANKSEFDVENVKQMVSFSVAKLYYSIIAMNKNIEILEEFASNYKKTLDLRAAQYKHGSITRSVLLQTKEQYNQTQTKVKNLKLERDLLVNSLKMLIYGLNTKEETLVFSSDLMNDFDMPSSIPSSVMTNRPDIAKAILDVKIAHNNAKIAKSSFFPKFSIQAGINASGSENIFSNPVSSIGANLLQPIFNLGANKQGLYRANVAQEIAVLNYEKTVKTALNEIENAILKYNNAEERLKDYDEIIALEKDIYKLNKIKFKEGDISFLEYLDSERALQNSLIEQTNLRLAKITAGIDAYKAIGIKKLEFRE